MKREKDLSMESIIKGSVFIMSHKLSQVPVKFRYNKLIEREDEKSCGWHSVTRIDNGNTFEVENEWFRQRQWSVIEN